MAVSELVVSQEILDGNLDKLRCARILIPMNAHHLEIFLLNGIG